MVKVIQFVGVGIWNSLVRLDAFFIRYVFQPIVNASCNSWCRQGKGFLVFYVVFAGVIAFIGPVVIDEHDSLREIGESLIILISGIIAIRFILLKVIQIVVRIFSDDEFSGDEIARYALFALVKTVLVLGILAWMFLDIGEIFLTISMGFFLVAVFFECCDDPDYAGISQGEYLGTELH